MSLTCQFEQLTSSYTRTELSREVVIESKLKVPETAPKIDSVIGGSIQLGLPVISMVENQNVLQITGTIYPEIFYTGVEGKEISNLNQHPEYDSGDDTNSPDGNNDSRREPKEHSFIWSDDNGVTFEEQIEIPDWQPENEFEVKLVPKRCNFEGQGPDRVNFSARIVLVVQPTGQKQAAFVKDLVVQPLEKVNISKDQITAEKLSNVKQMKLPVQTSLLLPSLKPGISRVLSCNAHANNVSWEYNRGKIYVKGSLDISVVYVGLDDDDQPTEIMSHEWNRDSGNSVPFETQIDTEIPLENLLVVPSITVLNTFATIKSRREIQCQVNLECQVAISWIHTSEIVTDVTPGTGTLIDVQKGVLNFEEYVGNATGEINFELSAEIPAGQTGADRLLTCQGQFVEPKVEATDGTATIEGNLNVALLYTAEGPGGTELHMTRFESRDNNPLSVAGMIDFPNLQPGSLLRIDSGLESIKAEIVNERAIKISGRVKARLLARVPRVLSIVEDCAEVIPVDPETRPSMMFYIVQPGDTLWKIARHYQTTVAQLVQSNQISNPDRIDAGRKLLIPKQVAG